MFKDVLQLEPAKEKNPKPENCDDDDLFDSVESVHLEALCEGALILISAIAWASLRRDAGGGTLAPVRLSTGTVPRLIPIFVSHILCY